MSSDANSGGHTNTGHYQPLSPNNGLPLPTMASLPPPAPMLGDIAAMETKQTDHLGVSIATDAAMHDGTSSPNDGTMTIGKKIFASARKLKHGPMKHMPLGNQRTAVLTYNGLLMCDDMVTCISVSSMSMW